MTTQHMLMYGLRRSPILALFQKTPVILRASISKPSVIAREKFLESAYPFLCLSKIPGVKWCTYVLVQIRRRMTRRSD